MKKNIILMAALISSTLFIHTTYSGKLSEAYAYMAHGDKAYQDARRNLKNWKSFVKQFTAALAIHYCGQTFTNTLYSHNRDIDDSLLKVLISVGQLITAANITDSVEEVIAHHDNARKSDWAHFWGCLLAIYCKKPVLGLPILTMR